MDIYNIGVIRTGRVNHSLFPNGWLSLSAYETCFSCRSRKSLAVQVSFTVRDDPRWELDCELKSDK